jgi:tetratricopeptide (TPR) repeat protein
MDEREIAGGEAAAHLAMNASTDEAREYLREQARLARLQSEQIEEENLTRRRMLKLEHTSAMFKLSLELAVAAVITIAAIAFGAALWSAATDNGLVVESFAVPPDLAGRGLTGDVVAARLLDRLQMLQGATQSNRAPSSYANNWGSDIKVQIPDTGVSIGEFVRLLHTWLGHQTRISGEIWRTANGIAVTARAGSATSPTFTGSDADLDKLIQKAAESVYRATQPYRYAVYLANAGRSKEAQAAYESLIATGSDQDRAWAYVGLENIYTSKADFTSARAALENALAIKPGFVLALINLYGIDSQLQRDEEELAMATKIAEHMNGPRDPDIGELAWRHGVFAAQNQLAGSLGDFMAQAEANRGLQALPEFLGQVENNRSNDLVTRAFLHDGAGMRGAYARLPPTSNPGILVQRAGNHSFAELLLGNPRPIIALKAKFEAFFKSQGTAGAVAEERQLWPIFAQALAMTGDMKGAHALADKSPLDCTICLRERGILDMMDRNWGGADYWFARAAKDAPSPPFVWTDWGRAKLRRGDAKAAIAKFEIAHGKGPHFADPLEMWGEALMLDHRADLALAKFEEANRYAPNWGRLHLKWGDALMWSGHKDEARKQFDIASRLDLAPSEKLEVMRMKAGNGG